MVGPQQGSQHGLRPRLPRGRAQRRASSASCSSACWSFLAITFRAVVAPLRPAGPGVRPLVVGVLVLIAVVLPDALVRPARRRQVRHARRRGRRRPRRLAPLATAFFGWLWWVALLRARRRASVVAIARRHPLARLGRRRRSPSSSAVIALVAHRRGRRSPAASTTPSASQAALIGYLILAGRRRASPRARTSETRRQPRRSSSGSWRFRPGLPLVVLGLVLGLLALFVGDLVRPAGNERDPGRHRSALFAGTALPAARRRVPGLAGLRAVRRRPSCWPRRPCWTAATGCSATRPRRRVADRRSCSPCSRCTTSARRRPRPSFAGADRAVAEPRHRRLAAVASRCSRSAPAGRRRPRTRRRSRRTRRSRSSDQAPVAGPAAPASARSTTMLQPRAVRRRAGAVLPADGDGVLAAGAGHRHRRLRAAGRRPQRGHRLGRPARPRLHRLLRASARTRPRT